MSPLVGIPYSWELYLKGVYASPSVARRGLMQ